MSNPTFLYLYSEEGKKSPEVIIDKYDLRDFYQILLLPIKAGG
jgi:hypothetical protein